MCRQIPCPHKTRWPQPRKRVDPAPYGRAHRNLRDRLLKALRDGDPCAEGCGEPMYRWQDLHLCHDHQTGDYKGLGHASCNASEGATRGNLARKQPSQWHARAW